MNTRIPAGHRLIGKWYNGLGNGQYARYQFTDVGAYLYSSPLKTISGTFAIEGDQLTISEAGSASESYTFKFECIGIGTFAEYVTLSDNATHLETPYVRDPTDPRIRQFCG